MEEDHDVLKIHGVLKEGPLPSTSLAPDLLLPPITTGNTHGLFPFGQRGGSPRPVR